MTLCVVAHPKLDSLCFAAVDAVRRGVASNNDPFVLHDLYRDRFDPVLSEDDFRRNFSFDKKIQQYQRDLRGCDLWVIVYPEWWGQTPAILKGWLDCVLRVEIAYRFNDESSASEDAIGLLAEKKALICCVTAASTRIASSIEPIWNNALAFCGIKRYAIETLRDVRSSSKMVRNRWLETIRARAEKFSCHRSCSE